MENDLQKTILQFNKDMVVNSHNLLFRKLQNSSLLFIGHGYDEWLYRLLIQTIVSESFQYVKSQQDSFIIDNFENKKDPFKELPRFLKNYGTEVLYSEDGGGTFVDTLFERLEEKYPDEIIPVSDFPKTVFISFAGPDRPAARKLASKLKKDGIGIWLDEYEFEPGDRVGETILKALDKCPVFMPLISKNSEKILSSNGKLKYHVQEWEWAYSRMISGNNPKEIIPVIIDDTNWIYEKFEALLFLNIPNGDPNSSYRGDYDKLVSLLKELHEVEAKYGPVTVDTGTDTDKDKEEEKRDRQKFYYDKAKKLFEKKKYDEALSFIQKAEEEKIVDENTLYLKSKTLEKKGDEDKASQLRMELINANTLSADFYNDEATFLIQKQRYWDAISIIEKAVKRNCADDNTRTLKKTVLKSLSDDEETLFRQNKDEDKGLVYPEAGSILGRDGEIESTAEILDKIPILTMYGIPGTGKSTLIYEIWKSKSHSNRLYMRFIIKPGMTINDLFEQLAPILGCGHLLNQADSKLSAQSGFSFLEKEAQYHVESLIHLDRAQFLFNENRFGDTAVKKFLTAITKFYPGTKIIMESCIVPPDGIFPENLHQSHRLHGINKDGMILYFCQPFKDNPKIGWVLEGNEQHLVLKNLEGIKKKEKVHPLAMILVARMARQLNKTPVEILTDTTILKGLIGESEYLMLAGLNKKILQSMGRNMVLNIEMYREDIPVYLYEKLETHIEGLLRDTKFEDSSIAAEFGLATADYWENELRTAVTEKLFPKGKKHLQEIIKIDSDNEERLKREFGFIYDFENPEEDENNWKQKEAQIEWRRKVWQILSERNNFILL